MSTSLDRARARFIARGRASWSTCSPGPAQPVERRELSRPPRWVRSPAERRRRAG